MHRKQPQFLPQCVYFNRTVDACPSCRRRLQKRGCSADTVAKILQICSNNLACKSHTKTARQKQAARLNDVRINCKCPIFQRCAMRMLIAVQLLFSNVNFFVRFSNPLPALIDTINPGFAASCFLGAAESAYYGSTWRFGDQAGPVPTKPRNMGRGKAHLLCISNSHNRISYEWHPRTKLLQ
eukprot:gb/GEZJ01002439.1/.p1 GENE.gb/GEZJ01002439.1/~~gb/GEZJ01002439.1/.p1  ORF type:complete len:182 (-),score=2.53 gb/GEZJ01002439.1/:511-1056(-)